MYILWYAWVYQTIAHSMNIHTFHLYEFRHGTVESHCNSFIRQTEGFCSKILITGKRMSLLRTEADNKRKEQTSTEVPRCCFSEDTTWGSDYWPMTDRICASSAFAGFRSYSFTFVRSNLNVCTFYMKHNKRENVALQASDSCNTLDRRAA